MENKTLFRAHFMLDGVSKKEDHFAYEPADVYEFIRKKYENKRCIVKKVKKVKET